MAKEDTSYLVLARKWRPQLFEEVVGQQHITQTLQNAISQKRVAHAFLFTGARGVGKTSTARILAKALNCEKGCQINPCDQCTNCREITLGISMDVIEIDGASNRGIDEIREVRENVHYTPAKSRYKIYIIDEVHMLTKEAFNALLKTLEEPPPHIIFIFATTEPHKIPATILSRCQRYDFKRIPFREVIGSLKRIVKEEKIQISQGGLLSIAQESEGSLRDAESLLDQVIAYAGENIRDEDIAEVLGLIDRKTLRDTIEAIANRDVERCMEVIEHVYHFGYDLQHFCRELLQYLRNLILIKVSQHPEGLMELSEEELEWFKKQAEKFQFDQLNHLFSLLLKGEQEIAQSTFSRTMLEMTLIRMATLRPILPIDEIVKKLEALEKKELSKGWKEKKTSPAFGRVIHSEDPERDQEKEESSLKKRELTREGEVFEKNEDSKDLKKEEEFGAAPPKIWEEKWKGLVDFTRARNPILGSFLALGNLVHLSDEKIEIGFDKDSFHYERMLEKENRNQLESICHEYLQKKTKVVVSPVSLGMGSKRREVLNKGETARNELEKRSEKREENPIIQEALRLFNGKIVEK
ncbi:MAG: DNA polymerase III subunit gamma/tau [Deltaproteobacteria bacterium CG_4_8_14_3_um_filter_45_9]|nr:MAG: DNA polymerase III subunit gamma/tau [Deltaproteobacteria bacterium CG03_land_8_20_14_0_80_45_14]PIX23121.1 MAG: DNA polymerase III subunit gamma/tau [Deltaproteobacteria bacterium CG_4_8_14_3_um_filter_45_9]